MSILKKKIGFNYIYQDDFGHANCWLIPNDILQTWDTPIVFVQEDRQKDISGFRSPQIGAIFAIKSYWTVSNESATIVMPTGTGKTETMIATIISERCEKTLLIVPSKLLRDQTVKKCISLGVLRDIGVIPSNIYGPAVSCLRKTPSDEDELNEIIENSNILVATVSLLNNFGNKYIELLAKYCSTIIIDEAHHIAAKTWSELKSSFSAAKCLQFTATPFRNDGKKVDGRIIYNFPLLKAQEQKYFQPISFFPIYEFVDEKSDIAVAQKAVEILEEDIVNNYPHILLVRAKSKERAIYLFEEIYKPTYSKYNPVLIISGMGERKRQEALHKIQTLESRILVCVDMFKEGIDIPNLKIAAIHDKYKSLPITMQFVGRFARSQTGLGSAKFVANIADEEVEESLIELYAQDSDWNEMLCIMSDRAIGQELTLQELAQGFKGSGLKNICINQLVPKVSMIAFKTNSNKWRWKNWTKVFNEDKCRYYVNEDRKLLIIIEMLDSKVDWTVSKDINNINWQLHILYWNEKKKIFFVNTTEKVKANELAKNIFDHYQRITGEEVFRCLYGINRLMFATVGLNSAIDGPIRYKMFAGIDIAQGLSEAQKENCIKSNLFGVGYNGKGKVSIGCSYKGTIWAKWVKTVDFWIGWCDEIADKILNPNIDVSHVLEGALKPIVIKERPKVVPYRIDWPIELDICCDETVEIELPFKNVPIYMVEIRLLNYNENGNLTFYIGNSDFKEVFELIIEENEFHFIKTKSDDAKIIFKNKSMSLIDFFNEYPPTIKFVDQSTLEGNLLVKLNMGVTQFNRQNIIKWDWSGTNIRKESQGDKTEKDSIQYKVIETLKSNTDYCVIFDDDNPGEIADVIGIKEKDDLVLFEFYHCKYAHGGLPGSRVSDLYEVCCQAEKSVVWMQDSSKIIERMIKRENDRLRTGKPTRFEKGDMKKLKELKNKMRFYPSKVNVFIVQPGVDSGQISTDMERLLCGTSSYLMETYSIPLTLICS